MAETTNDYQLLKSSEYEAVLISKRAEVSREIETSKVSPNFLQSVLDFCGGVSSDDFQQREIIREVLVHKNYYLLKGQTDSVLTSFILSHKTFLLFSFRLECETPSVFGLSFLVAFIKLYLSLKAPLQLEK